jgi:hypothetical protein
MTRSRCRTTLFALFAMLTSGALIAGPAFASGKPFVETRPATAITANTATLHGVVNPNGAETKYYFQYGATVLYGKTTAEATAGAGITNVEVSKAIESLTELTSYHFRLVATNSNGTTFGADQVFSTAPTPGLPEFSPTRAQYTLKGGFVKFEDNERVTYGCSASSGTGEITGAKTATVSLKFTGCGANGWSCQNEGAPSGEIKTGTLPAVLEYISRERQEAGLVVNYTSGTIAKWSCGTTTGLGLRGAVVAAITPVNSSSSTHTVTFAKTANIGEQNPTQYENGEKRLVTAWPEMALINQTYFQGAVTDQLTLTTSEAVNIKA